MAPRSASGISTFLKQSAPLTSRAQKRAMSSFRSTPYVPRHQSWPYTPRDFVRLDESSDVDFYSQPRFVTHIDDTAIAALRKYYAEQLPAKGKILDICSSWVSHFPDELEKRAIDTVQRRRAASENVENKGSGERTSGEHGSLEVIGLGMNDAELAANPILSSYHLIDLNTSPNLSPSTISPPNSDPASSYSTTDTKSASGPDAATCVVSIDYLTQPLTVLSSLRKLMNPRGKVHLAISNRCFYTKVVGRWLRISEEERVKMVADYLHFSGWENVEMVEVVQADDGGMRRGTDPLWVVRGSAGKHE